MFGTKKKGKTCGRKRVLAGKKGRENRTNQEGQPKMRTENIRATSGAYGETGKTGAAKRCHHTENQNGHGKTRLLKTRQTSENPGSPGAAM